MAEIWGLAIAAVGTVAGAAISSQGAQSAAKTAANANLVNTQNTNATNLAMFQQSRGAPVGNNTYGNSILPTYSGAGEQDMFNQSMGQFNTIAGQANNVYGQQQNQLNAAMPSFQSSLNTLGGLYNGQNLQQQLGFNAPLYNANLNYAQTQGQGMRQIAGANSNAINTGLAQTMAQISAQNNNQGFLGSSTFNNNRMLQATIPAQQQAAIGNATANANANNLFSQAMQGNQQQTQGLQMQDLANRANPSLMAGGLGAVGQALSSPLNALSQNYQSAQAPLNFFRISPQAWQQQNMPTVYPQITNGQIAGGAIGSLGQAAGTYMQQQQQNQFLQQLLNGNQSAAQTAQVNQMAPYFNPTSPYAQSNGGLNNFNFMQAGNNSFGLQSDPYSSFNTPGTDANNIMGSPVGAGLLNQ